MSYRAEFKTVDLVMQSSANTRGVDAFALALIKAERQTRKLFTHLIYQFPCFGPSNVRPLRETLAANRRVYFAGCLRGFDALYPRTVGDLIGPRYQQLLERIIQAIDYRNKIFHGQLTTKSLKRNDLLAYVQDIREWCSTLAVSAKLEFDYDGFARNSFQKSSLPEVWKRFRVQIATLDAYTEFIRQHMARQP